MTNAIKTDRPDFVFDNVVGSYLHRPTGVYFDDLPPTRRYRHIASKPFAVEQHVFAAGTILGVGTLPPTPIEYTSGMFTFEPAEQFEGVVGNLHVGHVAARLPMGKIIAEPIEETTAEV